jgi:hypothetical protein
VTLVLLDLRTLVLVPRVLHGEIVQVEAGRDLLDLLVCRVVDAQPDKSVAGERAGGRVGDRHRPGMLPCAASVVSAVNDHGSALRSVGFGPLSRIPARSARRRRPVDRPDARRHAHNLYGGSINLYGTGTFREETGTTSETAKKECDICDC